VPQTANSIRDFEWTLIAAVGCAAQTTAAECLFWVKGGHRPKSEAYLLTPQKQT
jgi:hypothetical protein